jgi:hypothetical protein
VTQLGTVWREEWTALVETFPSLQELCPQPCPSPFYTASGAPQLLPSKAVQQRAFPTVFAASLPEPRSHWLRKYSIARAQGLTTEEEQQLRAAIAAAAPWLARLGALVPRVQPNVTAAQLGVRSLREGVLGLCVEWSRPDRVMSDDELDRRLERFKADRGSVGPDALRRALRDPSTAAAVEGALSERAGATTPVTDGDLVRSRLVLADFLDTPGLAALAAPAAVRAGASSAEADTRWAAAVGSGVEVWHGRARHIWLSAHDVPPVPEVSPGKPLPVLEPVRWLDASITERLAPALDFPVGLRPSLPPLEHFVDEEVLRATSSLGLLDPVSRTLVALGAVVTEDYVDAFELETQEAATRRLGGTAAPRQRNAGTLALMRSVKAWRQRNGAFEARAGFPGQAVAQIIDLPRWYMSTLWRRVHTREVQETIVSAPGEVWALLTQVRRSTLGNIRGKPWLGDAAGAGDELPEPLGAGAATAAGAQPLEVELTIDAMMEALPLLASIGAELPAFLHSQAWGLDEHEETWAGWCRAIERSIPYAAVRAWWDRQELE